MPSRRQGRWLKLALYQTRPSFIIEVHVTLPLQCKASQVSFVENAYSRHSQSVQVIDVSAGERAINTEETVSWKLACCILIALRHILGLHLYFVTISVVAVLVATSSVAHLPEHSIPHLQASSSHNYSDLIWFVIVADIDTPSGMPVLSGAGTCSPYFSGDVSFVSEENVSGQEAIRACLDLMRQLFCR